MKEYTDALPSPAVQIIVQIDDEFLNRVVATSIEAAAQETLRHQKVESGTITIVVTDDEEIRRLNREFRQIDRATDVLSFAAEDDGLADSTQMPPELAAELQGYLGDLIIAYPYAAAQAKRFGSSIEAELRLLTVHGTLHLLGYDHDNADSQALMWAIQEAILATFGDKGLSNRSYPDQ